MKKITVTLLLLCCLYSCRRQPPPVIIQPDGYYQKAETLLDSQSDSAYYYYNKVVGTSKDSLQIASAYNRMASLQSDAGDYFGSQETLSMSLKFLSEDKPSDRGCLGSDYNELGTTSLKLRNFDQAISFYERAIRMTDKKEQLPTFYNNLGTAYEETGDHDRALHNYRVALSLKPSKRRYARILTNAAMAKWAKVPRYDAAPELMEALRIRREESDRWGENSSYSHLADYYRFTQPDSALFYANKMYAVAAGLHSPDDRLEALQKLILLAPEHRIKSYFSTYQSLDDSLRTARSAARNQFALIRYDAEKNKLDNLRLQKENTEKKYELIKKNALFYSTAGLLILMAVGAVLWYRKRKRQQEEETREVVRETQRKASKKVHDTLANDIYRVMKKVQHETTLDRDGLVDDIDEVYKRARDISYEMIPGSEDDFHEKISALLRSFGNESTKVLVVGNSAELWQKINPAYKFELKYILQELMVNMQKHSRASNVVIKFEEDADHCLVTYVDDGIGMPEGTLHRNGLTNTGNRIKAMHGELTFDSSSKGLTIQLCFKARLS